MYLKTSQKLERKFETIADLEIEFQQLLKQIRNVNKWIFLLSEHNLNVFGEN